MEDVINRKDVVSPLELENDIKEIYLYSLDTFGRRKADEYLDALKHHIRQLADGYLMYPECRQLPTKGKIYRRVIVESHIIIYRIAKRVEVLRIFHSASSNRKIRSARTVNILIDNLKS